MVWYVLVRWPSQVAREGKGRGATTKGRRLVQAVKFVRLCRVGYNSPWFPPRSRGEETGATLRDRENSSLLRRSRLPEGREGSRSDTAR